MENEEAQVPENAPEPEATEAPEGAKGVPDPAKAAAKYKEQYAPHTRG
jgi:hypothetical protein